ncbi:DUF6705 family protein [Chryseobacterium indoltheticum]|uniref:DUF6705 domain-containing protein n=1 Tax=Chryseobacterium indoltheticum TaxID=254 RepID=A0A381FHW0_9FLAO|nr:DUF6705 family protein [Chryseobacterium indoltheticum]SUX46135.1 Uncharacterised protein [Chryseobacterium indoltheticum]
MNFVYKIIIIFTFGFCKAQNKPNIEKPTLIPCSSYNPDNSIDKFIGTWEGNSNGKSITFILEKEKIIRKNSSCMDAIIGFHKFIDNGLEIENYLQFAHTLYSDGKSTTLGGTENSNTNLAFLLIDHKSKNKVVKAFISYIDATHLKIDKIENLQGTVLTLPGQPAYDSSIALPSNIILTKQ